MYVYFCFIFTIISLHLFAALESHFRPVQKDFDIHSFKNIDFIYLINLDERPEKLAKTLSQLHPYSIYPCRFSAIHGWKLPLEVINDVGVKFKPWMKKGMVGTYFIMQEGRLHAKHEIMKESDKSYFVYTMKPSAIGIALSHLSVLYDAYQAGYKTIWVLEDDIDVIRDPTILPDFTDKLDALVGSDGWDILFTDIDIKNKHGEYLRCTEYAPRPNFTPKDRLRFAKREVINPDFSRVGARYGGHSMIIRRSGIEKLLNFIHEYSIFHAIDVDYVLPEDIRLYSLNYDVVSQLTNALSDNFSPNYAE